MEADSPYAAIYAVVSRIPPGRVCTYGRVAALAGLPGHARMVGYALHLLLPHSVVPWWRVINRAGRISNVYAADEQRARLQAEGWRSATSIGSISPAFCGTVMMAGEGCRLLPQRRRGRGGWMSRLPPRPLQ